MNICRVVFRIDFDVNYEIIDSAGKIMRMMGDNLNSDLKDLGEAVGNRRISARFISKERDRQYHVTVDPISIHFTLEILGGATYDKLETIDEFNKLIKITNLLRKEFSISNLKRLGFRLFCLDNPTTSFESSKKTNLTLIDSSINSKITDTIGTIDDVGLSFDGTNEDGIGFHLRFGPYKQSESDKYFDELKKEFAEIDKFNLIYDIDFFEKAFELNKDVSILKWIGPNINRFKKLSSSINSIISNKSNKG